MRLHSVQEPGPPNTQATGSNDLLSSIAVLIPAWQPEARLLALVDDLRTGGIRSFVLVDDGSTPDRRVIFQELESQPGVKVLRHTRNLGKGCALKFAFRHTLDCLPAVTAVVTADADGQHLPADILRVARHLALTPTRPVLGVRSFTGSVPMRSRVGNFVARVLFTLLTGYTLRDTQTGLRGLPVSLLPALLELSGERYEYETVMLAHLCRTGGLPDQIAIETVYLDSNRASHFNPVWDSLRVYRSLFRLWHPFGRKPLHVPDHPRASPLQTA